MAAILGVAVKCAIIAFAALAIALTIRGLIAYDCNGYKITGKTTQTEGFTCYIKGGDRWYSKKEFDYLFEQAYKLKGL